MSASGTLRIGLSASIFHPDPTRTTFNGRRLLYLEESMGHFVMRHGALPILLPTVPVNGFSVEDLVSVLDAVILTGGVDMAPESYGEKPLKAEWSGDAQRDAYEVAIVRAALKLDKPILGICRGHQVLNVAMGGTLFQDVSTQNPGALVHRRADIYEKNEHEITFEQKGFLTKMFGAHSGQINSVHHQAVKQLGKELILEGVSSEDQIVEAFRLKDTPRTGVYGVGVQWHPEFQDPGDARLLPASPLIEDLLAAAKKRRS